MNAGGVPNICKSSGKAPADYLNSELYFTISDFWLKLEMSLNDVLEYTSGGRVSNA